jgi:hypothetical protein
MTTRADHRDQREAPGAGALRFITLIFGLVVASVVASWPLAWVAAYYTPSASEMPDLSCAIWLPWHLLEQLAALSSPWESPALLWPHGQDIALNIWNLGAQTLQAPFYLFFEPILAYNLSIIFLAALNGLGGWVLGRVVGGCRASGLAGAALLVFSPYAWNELAQGRCEQGVLLWLALALSGVVVLARGGSRRTAVLTGAAWAAAGLTYWFYGYFLLLAVGALALLLAASRAWRPLLGLGQAAITAALLAGGPALHLLLAVLREGSIYQRANAPANFELTQHLASSASIGLAQLAWFLEPPDFLWGVVPLLTVPLLAYGLSQRRLRPLALLGLLGLLLAFGRQLQWTPGGQVLVGSEAALPFTWLQGGVPGFERLWWPYRFLSLCVVAAAGCAGALVARLGRGRWWVAALVACLALGELRLAQQHTHGRLIWDRPEGVIVPAFFDELAQAPGEHPLLLLPLLAPGGSRPMWLAYHRQAASGGLGDADDVLLPADHLAFIEAEPALATLAAVGDGRPAPQDGTLRPALWLTPSEPHMARYEALLGGSPSWRDERIAVWEILGSLPVDAAGPR